MSDTDPTQITTTVVAQLPDQQREGLVEAVGDPQIIADGGVSMRSPAEQAGYETRAVEGGTIVFDADIPQVGKRPVGLVIDDREAMRGSLRRLGIGVGALHQLEQYEAEEVEGL